MPKRTAGNAAGGLDELRQAARDAARRAMADPWPALRGLTDTEIVKQLLVPCLQALRSQGQAQGRVVDIGACVGTLSEPFLSAGFAVDMFEPDPECAPQLAAVVQRFPGLARHIAAAVVPRSAAQTSFNKRGLGLSGVGDSPYREGQTQIVVPATTLDSHLAGVPGGADIIKIDAEGLDFDILQSIDLAAFPAKVIMVEFGVEFPGQSPSALRQQLLAMEANGYDAVVFEYRTLPGFGTVNWDYELVDVAFDAERLGDRSDAFGNILFCLGTDGTMLADLTRLLQRDQQPTAQVASR